MSVATWVGAWMRGVRVVCAVLACMALAGCSSGTRTCTPPMYLYMGRCVVDFEGGVDAAMESGSDAQDAAVETAVVDVPRTESGADSGECASGSHRCGAQCVADNSVAGCGASCEVCMAPAGATAMCTSGRCGWACGSGFEPVGTTGCDVRVPRQIAPLSTATTTSQRPTFHWALGAGTDGARLEICQTRACAAGDVVMSVDATGSSGTLPANLRRGVWFWRLRGRVGGVTGTATSAVWEFTVGARSAPVDTSWGTTLDVNGDGFADVAVGAPGAADGVGQVYVYLGGAGGLATTPATTLTGPDGMPGSGAIDGYFGMSVASAGDVNGDGFADLIVGAFGVMNQTGRVYLYLGGPTGLGTTPQTLTGPGGESGNFGRVTASAGDVNADGFGDVVVGAESTMSSTGQAHVFFGSVAGLNPSPQTITGPDGMGGLFGRSVAGAGDINGDGFTDVIVGARDALSETGRVYVYMGSTTGLGAMPRIITGPDGPGCAFGGAVSGAGDINGDGYADVAIGAAFFMNGTGRVYVYRGSATGLGVTPQTLTGTDGPDANFGATVRTAGDINGDGYADLIVRANGNSRPQAYVYQGSGSGLGTMPQPVAGPVGTTGFYGEGAASSGDVNGDGYADAVFGAPYEGSLAGQAFIYLGGTGGLSATPQTLIAPDGGNGFFGTAVATAGRDGEIRDTKASATTGSRWGVSDGRAAGLDRLVSRTAAPGVASPVVACNS